MSSRSGFGGFLGGLEGLIKLMREVTEHGEVKEAGEIRGLPEGARGVYGFSVRTIAGAEPVIETFGNVKQSAGDPGAAEVREPLVDVFDEESRIVVVAEVPGASEDGVRVGVEGNVLRLAASSGTRKYARDVVLPCRIKRETVRTLCRNGVLEISAEKDE